jgi:hypothetical protein
MIPTANKRFSQILWLVFFKSCIHFESLSLVEIYVTSTIILNLEDLAISAKKHSGKLLDPLIISHCSCHD